MWPHGGTVTYTFELTLTPGDDGVPAQNIVVTDPQCDAPPSFTGGDTNGDGFLDAGETWTYTCSFAVPALHAAGEEDPIQNTATATGEDVDSDPLVPGTSNTVSVNIVHTAGMLAITKSANASSVAHGGTVTYTFNVTYAPGTDGSPAQNVVVTDAQCDAAATLTGGDTNGNGLLDGGETWTYSCSFAVPATHSAGEDDPIQNSATVSGQDLDGDAVTGGTSNTVSVNIVHAAGSLSIAKSANASSVAHGGTITYTFNVTYTPGADGSPAQNIVITEPRCDSAPTFVGGDTNSNGLLDGGESWTYTCTHAVPALHTADEEDPIVNTATVSGQDLDGDAVAGGTSNTVSVNVVHAAGSLAIVKSADRTTVAHGGTVTYTFAMTYTPGADGSPAQHIIVVDAQCAAPPALDGGDGNDTMRGGLGDDTFTGGEGDDAMHGRGGNDHMEGDEGSNRMRGGRGNDIMVGMEGDDHMVGGRGRDLMIGGDDADHMIDDRRDSDTHRNGPRGENADNRTGKGRHQDILIGGTTDYDVDDEALQAILAEWTARRSYNTRVENLRDGSGSTIALNEDFFLDSFTVQDDGVTDRMRGSRGLD